MATTLHNLSAHSSPRRDGVARTGALERRNQCHHRRGDWQDLRVSGRGQTVLQNERVQPRQSGNRRHHPPGEIRAFYLF